MFVLENINYTEINIYHYCSDFDAEACALKIYLEKKKLLFMY